LDVAFAYNNWEIIKVLLPYGFPYSRKLQIIAIIFLSIFLILVLIFCYLKMRKK